MNLAFIYHTISPSNIGLESHGPTQPSPSVTIPDTSPDADADADADTDDRLADVCIRNTIQITISTRNRHVIIGIRERKSLCVIVPYHKHMYIQVTR